MSDGGKGSSPRPFSVTQEEYAKRWDMIFGRDLEGYQDILTTEECVLQALEEFEDKLTRNNQETQEAKQTESR